MSAADSSAPRQPITLTTSPCLDATIHQGWDAWITVVQDLGASATSVWLSQRAGDRDLRAALFPALEAVLTAGGPDDEVEARIELAELSEVVDDLVVETCWEGVLLAARAAGDGDAMAVATTRLATISEAHGDALTAAELYIEFLNWRRQPGSSSDSDAVATSFEEIIRLAERDRNPKAAAIYTFRYATFTQMVDRDDGRVVAGDWEANESPYEAWQ